MKRNSKLSHSSSDLKRHLSQEHKISPVSEYLREIVYGGVDGIITTFAVVAGFTGANSGSVVTYSFLTVLLFGFANLFADATSMGLGNFLSIRAQKDVYRGEKDKELREIKNEPDIEKAETQQILINKGFSKSNATTLTNIYAQNEQYWLEFMMQHELELPNPEGTNPVFTGIATSGSFLFFGFIPLFPYLFLTDIIIAFSISVFATVLALVLLGMVRWGASRESLVKSVSEMVLLGGTSAVVAFGVGMLFRK